MSEQSQNQISKSWKVVKSIPLTRKHITLLVTVSSIKSGGVKQVLLA